MTFSVNMVIRVLEDYNVKLQDFGDIPGDSRWIVFALRPAPQPHINLRPDSEEQELNRQHLNSPFFLQRGQQTLRIKFGNPGFPMKITLSEERISFIRAVSKNHDTKAITLFYR